MTGVPVGGSPLAGEEGREMKRREFISLIGSAAACSADNEGTRAVCTADRYTQAVVERQCRVRPTREADAMWRMQ